MDNTLYYIDERRSNVVKSVLVGILLKYVLYIFGCYFKMTSYYTMLIQLNFPIFFFVPEKGVGSCFVVKTLRLLNPTIVHRPNNTTKTI